MNRILFWALGFSAALLLAVNVEATTFNVTPSTGGGCSDGTPGNCTLSEALAVAQANGKNDTIQIAPGSYLATNSIYTAAGTESFTLAITGTEGAGQTILNGDGGILMQISAGGAVTVTGLTFTGGLQPIESGGGLDVVSNGPPVNVQNCIFRNNSAETGGGLAVVTLGGAITVTGTTFTGNLGTESGGGAALAVISGSGAIQMTGNSFLNNLSGESGGGAALFTQSSSVTLTDNRWIGNSSAEEAGGAGVTTTSGTVSLTRNTFQGNSAQFLGGLIINSQSGSVVLRGNDVRDNSVSDELAGIEISAESGNVTLINNIVFNNTAVDDVSGLGIQVNTGQVTLINNTIANNILSFKDSPSVAAGFVLSFGDPTLASATLFNNIIFGNLAAGNPSDISLDDGFSGTGASVGFFNNDFSTLFSACDDNGGCTPAVTETASLHEDPLFVNFAGGDLHLLPDSPAVNKGTSAVPGGLPATDFDGNPRVIGSQVDIGAFENGNSAVSVSPSTQSYGDVAVGSTASKVFTITNDGVASVTFSTMTLSDAVNYSLNLGGGGSPCGSATVALDPGQSCTIEGVFGPVSEGLKAATLTLNSNSSGTPILTVQLFGAGTDGSGGGGGGGGGGGCSLGAFASPNGGALALFLTPLFYAAVRRLRRF